MIGHSRWGEKTPSAFTYRVHVRWEKFLPNRARSLGQEPSPNWPVSTLFHDLRAQELTNWLRLVIYFPEIGSYQFDSRFDRTHGITF